jgi:hypothetical protein
LPRFAAAMARNGGCALAVTLSPREVSQILAALRFWQQVSERENIADDLFEAYFEEHEPMSGEEIDALCQKVVAGLSE